MNAADDDDEVMARLAAAVEAGVGEMPADLSDVARDAGRWMLVDEELATLVDAEAAAVRDSDADATSTYAAGPFTVELAVVDGALVGTVAPAAGAVVVVEVLEQGREIALDARGRFRVPDIDVPYRVRISGGAHRIATPWVTV